MGNRRMRRGLFFLLIVFILSCSLPNPAQASGNLTISDEYNIMLLIDKSGSMTGTDEQRLALNAACQFVEQLCTSYNDLALSTNVHVMAFDSKAYEVGDWRRLDTEENTAYLKSKINGIEYNESNTGSTDLNTAFYDAAVSLEKIYKDGQKNMIVMFTDGYSDRVADKGKSEQKLKNAFKKASGLACEVYIVGLNQDGKIKAEGKQEIYNLADTAQIGNGIMEADKEDGQALGGNVNYKITDNMGEVRKFYGYIYAKMVGGDIEFVDNHEFTVSTDDIVEADVTVYSDSKITKVEVTSPDKEIQKEDGETFFISGKKDPYYRILRIINPKRGRWNVDVSSKSNKHKTFVVKIHGIRTSLGAKWGQASKFSQDPDFQKAGIDKGYVAKADLAPIYIGNLYKGEDAADAEAKITVTSEDGTKDYPMDYSQQTGTFVAYFPVQDGEYIIQSTWKAGSAVRNAEYKLKVNISQGGNTGNENQSNTDKDVGNYGNTGNDGPTGPGEDSDKDTDEKENRQMLAIGVCAAISLIIIFVAAYLFWKQAVVMPGEFKVRIVFLWHKDKKQKNIIIERMLRDFPKRVKFSLWEIISPIIALYEKEPDTKEEGKMACERIREEQDDIKRTFVTFCKKNGRKAAYIQKAEGFFKELKKDRMCECYRSAQCAVEISFHPDFEQDAGVDMEDVHKPPQSIGRKSGARQ